MADQRRNSNQRPSPDALLAKASKEENRAARLKIFLGAAPGVGKTFEMLQEARARLKDGADVVAGVVETHGRPETEALVEGLEVVPRHRLEYKGRQLEEMDLDALLRRRPKLALVDELAHTNVPGSRHPKRYMDVEELLRNGIDVYTTLNVQHVESLNDVVAQITHVRMRETVPNSILDRADDIELVDITPDDLIQRLREGKVYVPKQAERALEHFFSPANLTALRELALRRTAERVDEQLLMEMQARAISGPWPAGDRLLVCVSEDPRAAGLVRYTKRLADRLHAPWTALYVETKRSLQLTEEERDRVADTLRLAQALGGEQVTIPGGDRRIADDVVAFAQANNITQVIVGKSTRSRWFELLNGSVVRDLSRACGNISLHVIAGEEIAGEPVPKKTVRPAERRALRPQALHFCLAGGRRRRRRERTALALDWHSEHRPRVPHGCRRHCRSLRLMAFAPRQRSVGALLQFLLHRAVPYVLDRRSEKRHCHCFLHHRGDHRFQCRGACPHSRGHGNGPGAHHRVALRVQPQARRRRHPRRFALGDGVPDGIDAESQSGAPAARGRLDRRQGGLSTRGHSRRGRSRRSKWAWEHDRPAGRGSDTLPGAKRLFLPMRTGRGAIGVVGIDSDKPGRCLLPISAACLMR